MRKSLVILACLLVAGAAFAEAEPDFPSWYMHPPHTEDNIVVMGVGEGKPEALTVALMELARMMEMKVESQLETFAEGEEDEGESSKGEVTRAVSTHRFGMVEVKGMDKSMAEMSGAGYREETESVIEVSYSPTEIGGGKARMRYTVEWRVAAGDTTESATFEFHRRDCDLQTVIGELEENGVEITGYESRDDLHYIMLVYDAE